jgi:Holliday junction resolvasome RuvABC endonuclease subunit
MTLALDLGTTTGWAYLDKDGKVVSGSWQLKPTRFESVGQRFVKLRKRLDEIAWSIPFETVYFEAVGRHLGTDAAHAYGGYLAVLQSWCEDHHREYVGVLPGAIKKFWTGKGNADKAAMVSECEKRGFAVSDDNEADAVALLHLCMEA